MSKTGTKYVYFFGDSKAEGTAKMKNLLGGKGANLADMTSIGLPVPPGFTISTEACAYYSEHNGEYPENLKEEVLEHLHKLEEVMGAKLGDDENPLLVSVRSGAAQSMPGMMDTVLNLGMTPTSVVALAKKTNNERFAWDSYRRFMQMFGDVVMGVPHHDFETALESVKKENNRKADTDLDVDDLKEVISRYRKIYHDVIGEDFPTDPIDQLFKSINAVFGSWNNDRAKRYRIMNDIRGLLGTAVNVQSMVFGNMGATSGTGVAFTRDPSTGDNHFYGEYLMNAQGEDVVAGIRTPLTIDTLRDVNEEVYNELVDIRSRLELHYKDMQDIEFTIQEGKLYMLQTRNGKRTVFSWLRSQVEMVEEGLITKATAVSRVPAGEFNKLFAPVLDGDAIAKMNLPVLTKGLNASPGGASGVIIFSANKAEEVAAMGKPVVLTRIETSPEDIGGMAVAKGVLTSRGGMTSHAAVVARGMGVPCVSGAGDLEIDYAKGTMKIGDIILKEGDYISIDGFTGNVYGDKIDVKPSEIVQVLDGTMKEEDSKLFKDYNTFMSYVDEIRTMDVRTNADTPTDVKMAVKLGAQGIGLCRTEHMFFDGDRINAMRLMVLAETEDKRRLALDKLLPMQKEDFSELFAIMKDSPVTIRLLDPPLHEFLPNTEEEIVQVAQALEIDLAKLKARLTNLKEFNPMLGHRGCRLAISFPEIVEMQAHAIFEAAILAKHNDELPSIIEVMIPFVRTVGEARQVVELLTENGLVRGENGLRVIMMCEIPSNALLADQFLEYFDGFSIGSNDLTQLTLGLDRDSGVIAHLFDERNEAVRKLLEMAIQACRAQGKYVGICGQGPSDHPDLANWLMEQGIDSVSLNPDTGLDTSVFLANKENKLL